MKTSFPSFPSFPMSNYQASDVQAVLFPVDKWTPATALAWLQEYNLKPIEPVHKTKHHLRYRIVEPEVFRSFITKKLNSGVELIVGFHKLD